MSRIDSSHGRSYPRDDTARKVSAALNMPFADLRPPKVPEEDPELREQLHEVLNRLERIELAVGVEEEAGEEEPLTAAEDAAADLAETGEEQQRKRSQTE